MDGVCGANQCMECGANQWMECGANQCMECVELTNATNAWSVELTNAQCGAN